MISQIVSGGQTGVDRAALDVARAFNYAHGGWCPAGRRAEDGPLDSVYLLRETPKRNYLQRTEWNTRDSDGTVVFTVPEEVTGGSKRTIEFAKRLGKPVIHISFERDSNASEILQRFIDENKLKVLNVAGSREETSPGIYEKTFEVLEEAIFGTDHLLAEATAMQWLGPEMRISRIVDHQKNPVERYGGGDGFRDCWRVYFEPAIRPLVVGGDIGYLLISKGTHTIIHRGVERGE